MRYGLPSLRGRFGAYHSKATSDADNRLQRMDHRALSDRLTVIAIAIIVYAGANVTHEIIGHCGTTYLLGAKCSFISTTDLRIIPEMPAWKFRIAAFAGSAANWLAALLSLALLRAWRKPSPALRFFFWLSVCVNILVPSTYLLVSPIIRFGDWYNITVGLTRQFAWRIAMVSSGAMACWFSFKLCRAELGKLIGFGGRAAQSYAWTLVAPAYLAGGAIVVAAALFSPLAAKWALFVAAGGTFGVTFWLLLLPLRIPEPPNTAEYPLAVKRSRGWLVAGVLCALVFVGVLGPGFPM